MLTVEQRTELDEIRNELFQDLMELAKTHDRRLYLACRTFDILEEAEAGQSVEPLVQTVSIESIISRREQHNGGESPAQEQFAPCAMSAPCVICGWTYYDPNKTSDDLPECCCDRCADKWSKRRDAAAGIMDEVFEKVSDAMSEVPVPIEDVPVCRICGKVIDAESWSDDYCSRSCEEHVEQVGSAIAAGHTDLAAALVIKEEERQQAEKDAQPKPIEERVEVWIKEAPALNGAFNPTGLIQSIRSYLSDPEGTTGTTVANHLGVSHHVTGRVMKWIRYHADNLKGLRVYHQSEYFRQLLASRIKHNKAVKS